MAFTESELFPRFDSMTRVHMDLHQAQVDTVDLQDPTQESSGGQNPLQDMFKLDMVACNVQHIGPHSQITIVELAESSNIERRPG